MPIETTAALVASSDGRIAEHLDIVRERWGRPLTFAQPAAYDEVTERVRLTAYGLAQLAQDRPLEVTLHHADGSEDEITVPHILNGEPVAWFQAGSAPNLLLQRSAS